MLKKLLIPILLLPQSAQAAQNGPLEWTIGLGGMLLLSVALFMFQSKANENISDKNTSDFADHETLYDKVFPKLERDGNYTLTIYRQSGNVHRSVSNHDANSVIQDIRDVMRRSKIDTVSVYQQQNSIIIKRTAYSGRGVREGRKIGSFEIILARKHNSSALRQVPQSELLWESEVRFEANTPEKLAIVKAASDSLANVNDQKNSALSEKIKVILDDNQENSVIFDVHEFYGLLLLANSQLAGTAVIDEEVRNRLSESSVERHTRLAKDETKTQLLGIDLFYASPSAIQTEFAQQWSILMSKSEHMEADFVKENLIESPDILKLDFLSE